MLNRKERRERKKVGAGLKPALCDLCGKKFFGFEPTEDEAISEGRRP
jgi:hypothetical protein